MNVGDRLLVALHGDVARLSLVGFGDELAFKSPFPADFSDQVYKSMPYASSFLENWILYI